MLEYGFSANDLEYFLLILVRVSCFVFIAPFFSMDNVPARVRIAISVFVSLLLYQVLTPAIEVDYETTIEYAILVIREACAGLLIGFGATICTAILNFAGSIADMETGLSMVTLLDPNSGEQTSITGVLYQYSFTLMLIASGMYRYLLGALADSFTLIPVGGAVFNGEAIMQVMIKFLTDYVIIGFRIVLPIFCTMLLLNAVLGVLAKVAPQMNMFSVGMQLKIIVGLSVLFFTAELLEGASDFIFTQMQTLIVEFVKAIQPV